MELKMREVKRGKRRIGILEQLLRRVLERSSCECSREDEKEREKKRRERRNRERERKIDIYREKEKGRERERQTRSLIKFNILHKFYERFCRGYSDVLISCKEIFKRVVQA